MSGIRKAAVAGTFYPDNIKKLHEDVSRYIRSVDKNYDNVPKVIIAPHAGYIYSGPVAASAYKVLEKVHDSIKRVVLLGPSHYVAFRGVALSSADFYETPFGNIAIDKEEIGKITKLPYVQVLDPAHAQEHSIEVHLPFLQAMLKDFKLVPLVIGDATPDQVSEVIERLWGGPETLIVISTDLSHYHGYGEAKEMDLETSKNIISKQFNVITPEDACGCRPINGILNIVGKLGLEGNILDVRNSGDTAGDKSRVVGYGAYHFGSINMDDIVYTDEHRKALLKLARDSIEYGLCNGRMMGNFDFPKKFFIQIPISSFVTIEIDGQLRGCIGSLEAIRSLPVDVMNNAYNAAFSDPRFPPLSKQEFENIDISISVLSKPVPMSFKSEQDLLEQIRPNMDGLILEDNGARGTFLPVVWDQLPRVEDFMANLKQKAGLPADYWSSTIKVYRYTTEYFGEK